MALTKKLVKIGNSLAIVIDKSLLELLNIDTDKEVTISVRPEANSLVITYKTKLSTVKSRAAGAVTAFEI